MADDFGNTARMDKGHGCREDLKIIASCDYIMEEQGPESFWLPDYNPDNGSQIRE